MKLDRATVGTGTPGRATEGIRPPERAIVGSGTPEHAWQAWPDLAAIPACTLGNLVPEGARVVVVAPHPDDEVLAFGGMLAMLAAQGTPIMLVAVTSGDASHPGSAQWPAPRLARRRTLESAEGLRRLGLRQPACLRLAIPDGSVRQYRAVLEGCLREALRPDDVVLTTWELDGHPDHEATAEAVGRACQPIGARHFQAPVWMWHWAAPGDTRVPWNRMRRLRLSDDALIRKERAISAHATQLGPQDTGAPAVLSSAVLARSLRCFEVLLPMPQPPWSAAL